MAKVTDDEGATRRMIGQLFRIAKRVGIFTSMTTLAEAIYEILRQRIGQADPRITYAGLARALRESTGIEQLTHRSKELYTALWEVGGLCRRQRLPPLPALVVRADTGRPGDAYFDGTELTYRDERIAAWQHDLAAVCAAEYPELQRSNDSRRRRNGPRSCATRPAGTDSHGSEKDRKAPGEPRQS